MLGQGAGHAPDPLVGRAGQDLSLPVPFLPETGDREREQGQRPALLLHRGHHLGHERLVLEAHPETRRGLDQRPAQGLGRGWPERRQVMKDGGQGRVGMTAEQEVVTEREQDVDAGLSRGAAEEGGKVRLAVLGVQREELLELVHDEKGLTGPLVPASESFDQAIVAGRLRRLREPLDEIGQCFRIGNELGRQGASEAGDRARSGCHVRRAPTHRPARENARPQERRLADSRWTDEREELVLPQLLPESRDLGLTPEEASCIRLRKRRQARVGPLLGRFNGSRPIVTVLGPVDRLQGQRQVIRSLEPVVRPLLQTSADDTLHRRRDLVRQGGQVRRLVPKDGGQGLRGAVSPEGMLAGEHLVEHGAEREDVRAGVSGMTLRLLRRHVAHRAHHRSRTGHVGRRGVAFAGGLDAGEAEVEDLHDTGRGEKEVVGLEVAVDDAAGVGGGEAAGDLDGMRQGFLERETSSGETRAEGRAFEELEDEVGAAVLPADVEDGEDVGVGESSGGPGLALEALQAIGICGDIFGEDLERHRSAKLGVARAVDLAHPPGTEGRQDLVTSKPDAG